MVLKIFFSSLGNSTVLGQYDQTCVPHYPSTTFDLSSFLQAHQTHILDVPTFKDV